MKFPGQKALFMRWATQEHTQPPSDNRYCAITKMARQDFAVSMPTALKPAWQKNPDGLGYHQMCPLPQVFRLCPAQVIVCGRGC